ncbi:MAG: hypothetical protein SCJ94_06805 [Bacillota bacterium]|nr:hypothetical protein [Bacillota bacterium]
MSQALLRKIKERAGCPQLDLQELAEAVTLDRKERRQLRSRQRKATAAYRECRKKWYEDLFD